MADRVSRFGKRGYFLRVYIYAIKGGRYNYIYIYISVRNLIKRTLAAEVGSCEIYRYSV